MRSGFGFARSTYSVLPTVSTVHMHRSEASEGLERLGGDRRGERGGHGSDRLRPSVPLALLPYFRAWRGCGIGWGRSQVEIYSERNEHSTHDEARLQPKASLTSGSKRGHADTIGRPWLRTTRHTPGALVSHDRQQRRTPCGLTIRWMDVPCTICLLSERRAI